MYLKYPHNINFLLYKCVTFVYLYIDMHETLYMCGYKCTWYLFFHMYILFLLRIQLVGRFMNHRSSYRCIVKFNIREQMYVNKRYIWMWIKNQRLLCFSIIIINTDTSLSDKWIILLCELKNIAYPMFISVLTQQVTHRWYIKTIIWTMHWK